MGFNSTTGSEAGKISKRGKSLNIDLRNDLKTLITQILKDLADHLIDTIDIHSLNNSERIALLRILVSYTVPKLAIEKPSINTEERLFQVEIIDKLN